MNIKFLLFAITAVTLTSCSTTYKSGQTPDDVYYSPIKVVEEDDSRDKEEVKNDSYEDNEIRMATRDRRWREVDVDYNCGYDPYHYGYNHGYYYNPYYYNRPVYIPGSAISNPKNTVARMTNLGSYNNTTTVMATSKTGTNKWVTSQRAYNNSNSNSSRGGGFFRTIIEPVISGSSNRSSDNNTRTYSPSSSSSSSGSSSGSRSGSVSRPGRGQ
ncbi:MAG TPA: hypothetical protein VK498_08705 [Ferruginibacter sp.]|nr:hypothetical protein [Ferruginibacter sp.]